MTDSTAKILQVGSAQQCVTFLQTYPNYANGTIREQHLYYALINALQRIEKLERAIEGPRVEPVRATGNPTVVVGGVFR